MEDRELFRKLVDEHKDRVVNTCWGFLHNAEDAEDTAQEVFIEVFLSYPKFKGNANISTWIYRIAVNKSLDALRRRNSKKRINLVKNVLSFDSMDRKEAESLAHDPGIEMEMHEQYQMLYRALGRIPVNQRIAVTLAKFENLHIREIAEVMEISEKAAESLIFRAKISLRKILEKYFAT